MSIIKIDVVSSEYIFLVNRIKARIWAQREKELVSSKNKKQAFFPSLSLGRQKKEKLTAMVTT